MEIQDLILTAHGLVEIQRTSVDSQPLAPHEIAGPTIASMISPGTEIQGCLLGENFPRKSGYACVIRVEQVGIPVASELDNGAVAIFLHDKVERQQSPNCCFFLQFDKHGLLPYYVVGADIIH